MSTQKRPRSPQPADAPYPVRLPCPRSQADIVNHASDQNPEPTAVPAPQRQFFGTLGARHVICLVGLPVRGRNYVASELGWYLEFFHGAEVKVFDVAEYADKFGEASREKHAHHLLEALEAFLQGSTSSSALNLGADARRNATKMQMTDQGRVAIVLPFRMSDSEFKRDSILLERSRRAIHHVWSGSTASDREWVHAKLAARTACKLMFVELEVTDTELRRQHIDNMLPENRAAFLALEAEHRRAYTPLGHSASAEGALSYLRLKNFRDMETHRMHGFLRMRIAQFLSVLRPWKHAVYLSRHGESTYNVEKKLGGNSGLSPLGEQYAAKLGVYAACAIQTDERTKETVCARLWTSSLIRTDLTAAHVPHPLIMRHERGGGTGGGFAVSIGGTVCGGEVADEVADSLCYADGEECTTPRRHTVPWQQMAPRAYRQLDEIFAGEYDGYTAPRRHGTQCLHPHPLTPSSAHTLTVPRVPRWHLRYTEAQIKEVDPRFSNERREDKLGMRYPKGESYLDLITRLEPLVHELLAFREPILIVSHQAVLRVLRAYLLHKPRERCHAENIPQHTVMKIVWDAWHFPPKPSPREATMTTSWPPPDREAWQPTSSVLVPEAVGTEEWVWLGPDTKRSDGQRHI